MAGRHTGQQTKVQKFMSNRQLDISRTLGEPYKSHKQLNCKVLDTDEIT